MNRVFNHPFPDLEYADYPPPSTYIHIGKYGPQNLFVPYVGSFFYDPNSCVNLDSATIQEYVRNQM